MQDAQMGQLVELLWKVASVLLRDKDQQVYACTRYKDQQVYACTRYKDQQVCLHSL